MSFFFFFFFISSRFDSIIESLNLFCSRIKPKI